jgi:(p)ppGpp synthase/HD superfamily hydrolase
MTTLLEAARALARSVHCGQRYGVGQPYTHHLAAVEEVLRRFGWADDEG